MKKKQKKPFEEDKEEQKLETEFRAVSSTSSSQLLFKLRGPTQPTFGEKQWRSIGGGLGNGGQGANHRWSLVQGVSPTARSGGSGCDTGGGWRTAAWQGRSGGWQSYNTGRAVERSNWQHRRQRWLAKLQPRQQRRRPQHRLGTGGGYNTGGDMEQRPTMGDGDTAAGRRQHDSDVECPTLGRRPVQGSQVSAKAT